MMFCSRVTGTHHMTLAAYICIVACLIPGCSYTWCNWAPGYEYTGRPMNADTQAPLADEVLTIRFIRDGQRDEEHHATTDAEGKFWLSIAAFIADGICNTNDPPPDPRDSEFLPEPPDSLEIAILREQGDTIVTVPVSVEGLEPDDWGVIAIELGNIEVQVSE